MKNLNFSVGRPPVQIEESTIRLQVSFQIGVKFEFLLVYPSWLHSQNSVACSCAPNLRISYLEAFRLRPLEFSITLDSGLPSCTSRSYPYQYVNHSAWHHSYLSCPCFGPSYAVSFCLSFLWLQPFCPLLRKRKLPRDPSLPILVPVDSNFHECSSSWDSIRDSEHFALSTYWYFEWCNLYRFDPNSCLRHRQSAVMNKKLENHVNQ